MFNVRNLRVGGSVGCLMSGIYVLAVVLAVVLADDVKNLRVGGSVGCSVDGGVRNPRWWLWCWRWCWLRC